MNFQSDISSNSLNCEEHKENKIDFACLNSDCLSQRFGCFHCIQEHHADHFKQIRQFSFIRSEIQNWQEHSEYMIQKIDKFIKEACFQLTKLRDWLDQQQQKFSKFPYELPMNELKNVIDEVIQYSQGKHQNMLDNVSKHIDDLKTTLLHGQSQIINESSKIQISEIENYQQITKLYKDEKYQESLDLISDALTSEPGNTSLLQLKAQIFYKLKQYQKALLICNSLNDTKNIKIQQIKLLSLFAEGDYQKVNELCTHLLEREPQNIIFKTIKAKTLFYQKQYSEAFSLFMELDYLSPKAEVKRYLGETLVNLGDVKQAILYLEEAIIYSPEKYTIIQKRIDQLVKGL